MAQYIFHNEYPSWEVDPSTRTATHPFTRYYPFKVTLSSTNTAEDILSVDRGNAGVNLVTNPSVERDQRYLRVLPKHRMRLTPCS